MKLQGSCDCMLCRIEREGRETLIPSHHFCAQCGHGYINTFSGRADDAEQSCQKCGAKGMANWVKQKPEFVGARQA